jgi:hypothetical protein
MGANFSADRIDMGDITVMDSVTSMTISAWIWIDTLPTTGPDNFQSVIRKDMSFTPLQMWVATALTQQIRCVIWAPVIQTHNKSYTLPVSEWFSYGARWNGNTASGKVEYFINGSSIGFSESGNESSGSIQNSSDTFRFGAATGTTEKFKGKLEEVALWSKYLSNNHMANLGKAKVRGLPLQIESSTLKGYWALDDYPHQDTKTRLERSTQQIWKDQSTFKNHGIGYG